MSQLRELAKPFPDAYVHKNPSGGGSYVKHHVVEQRLIQVLGIPPNFTVVEVLRGYVPAIAPNPQGNSKRAKEGRPALDNAVVGVVARMEATIDGKTVTVEEAGDCEQPHNWDTDGQRLKDAMSDAYKRTAMRLGCGLALWSQNEFFLFDALGVQTESAPPTDPQTSGAPSEAWATPEATAGDGDMAPKGGVAVSTSAAAPSSTQESLPSSETEGELVRLIREFVGEDKKRLRAVMGYAARSCINHPNSMPTNGLAGLADVVTLPRPVLEDVVGEIEKVREPA